MLWEIQAVVQFSLVDISEFMLVFPNTNFFWIVFCKRSAKAGQQNDFYGIINDVFLLQIDEGDFEDIGDDSFEDLDDMELNNTLATVCVNFLFYCV